MPQKDAHNSKARTVLVEGGNRSGKTEWLIAELSYHLTKMYPEWWEGIRYDRAVKVRLIGTDFTKHLGGVITPKLKKFLPRNKIKRRIRNQSKIYVYYEMEDGSTLELMSSEQDTDLYEGWDGDILGADEPPPRDKFIASKRGLMDTNGIIRMSMTPLDCAWVFDEIKCKSVEDENIECFQLNLFENPWISLEAIREFEKGLTEDEKEARLYGRYQHLTGIIYKEIDPAVHFIEPFGDGIPKHWNHFCILDPHDRIANALLWGAIDETGDIIFYDEAFIPNLTIEQTADLIKFKERRNRVSIRKRIIDPNFGNKKYGNTGKTVKDEYRLAGFKINHNLNFIDAIDDIHAGHAAVREYLRFDKKRPIGMDNHPKVYFYKTLKHTINGLLHYMWDEYRGNNTRIKEKPKDEHKHFPDCVRYLLVERPKYRSNKEIIIPYEQRTGITAKCQIKIH